MRHLIIALSTITLAACSSTDDGLRTINTDPQGALVQASGIGECETPCTIRIDRPIDIVVAKAGFNPQRLRIVPGRGDINLKMELAAPTDDVDTEQLPDL